MKYLKQLVIFIITMTVISLFGCSDSPNVPAQQLTTASHIQAGTPQDRIKNIEADTTLSDEDKKTRIAAIKERNHLP